MSEAVKQQIKGMNSQVAKLRDAYYVGSPLVSDGEYDKLESQLKALVKQYPAYEIHASALRTVGDTKNSSGRIRHARPMLSIENHFTVESFVNAAANYGDVKLIEPKRDGNSCEIYFKNGILERAVSRGDGDAGEDMTPQVKACKKIPQKIQTKISDLRMRGELCMSKSELARINALGGQQFSNPRNTVAGTMKQKNLEIVASREIILIPWDMYSPDEDHCLPDSSFERMNIAAGFGFPKYQGILDASGSESSLVDSLNKILKFNETSDIISDGVVVKADSHKVRNKLGVGSNFTKYQHCFKNQHLAAETTLLDIEYSLGRLGKITPVAILEPVDLGGAMISRASCCNETWIQNLGLMIGARVKVLRSGDVIPYITETVSIKGAKPIVFPTKCPSCGSKLQMDQEANIIQRVCVNSACPGKAAVHFKHCGNRDVLEIDCLGESLSEELVAHGITDIAGLFEFGNMKHTASSLKNSGYRSGANTIKMVKSLETAKTATWDRWFSCLGIPMVGHSLGEDIAERLNLGSGDMKNLPTLLLKLPKIGMEKLGEKKMGAIVAWAKNPSNIALCTKLYNAGVRPAQKEKVVMAGKKLDGISFVITGTLSAGTRKEVAARLEELGAVSLGNITSECNLLIVGEDPGSKLAKAQKKGIRIVDNAWVNEQLGL